MFALLSDALRAHPLAHGLDEAAIDLLLVAGRLLEVPPDTRLVRAGDVVNATYLVHEGRLDLRVPDAPAGRETIDTLGPGELVGWSWLNGPTVWPFDAVAIGPATVIELDGAILLAACNADPAFGFALTRRLLDAATQRLEHVRLAAEDPYASAL